ncbi:MAG: hypothetical protein RsTaC01_1016 [Candidatus Paraimprobicoccus trichonymphae]|uniref:Uncharacterized protein n=1 Tax=Candidatus Paraimprobicoccus trichonymphae TaxID=3033793 RepID=A0AA48L1M9_9FIRM|nr:MAG: hypothetical protein RsTaC01_1016 [Candidatus Paraimprobicoccus trichonymphae]
MKKFFKTFWFSTVFVFVSNFLIMEYKTNREYENEENLPYSVSMILSSISDVYLKIKNYFTLSNLQESNLTTEMTPFETQFSIDQQKTICIGESLKYIRFNVAQFNLTLEDQIKYRNWGFQGTIDYSDPQNVLGFSEYEFRENFKDYCFQDQDAYCYIIDIKGNPHCAGRFRMPLYGDLKLYNFEDTSEEKIPGRMFFIYSSGSKKLLDVTNILDSCFFDLSNPASNHNLIETIGANHNSAKNPLMLGYYYTDPTQGPWFMKKVPYTSFWLLHVINHDQSFSLFPKNIATKNGYVIKENNTEKFILELDDKLFRAGIVEDAPIALWGGENKFQPYQYNEFLNKNINIYITAAIPLNYAGTKFSDETVISHLRRHYLELFLYCKIKKIKKACISLIGTGVFNVKRSFHIKVLQELIEKMQDSGTIYFFNLFNKVENDDNFSSLGSIIDTKDFDNYQSLYDYCLKLN